MPDHRGEGGGPQGRGPDEADHPDRRQRLLNRLTIGEGILCGLRLEAAHHGKLRLSPGVAMDPLGRELVLDEPATIDPRRITDEEGSEVEVIDAGVVTIALAHRSRPTDDGRSADSVALLVLKGGRAASGPAGDLGELFPTGRHAAPGGGLARFLEGLEGDCFAHRGPAHVILGRVTLERDAALKIDASREAGRRLVVSNSVLLDLVIRLWEEIEALIGGRPSPPPNLPSALPKPTPPAPMPRFASAPQATPPPRFEAARAPSGAGQRPPGPAAMLQVVGVDFLDEWGRPQGTLDRLIQPVRFAAARGIGAIQLRFNMPLDPDSCRAIEPAAASILVRSDRGAGPDGHVPGTVSVQGNVARFQVDGGRAAFPAGEYEVTLFGDEDPAGRRPAIAARDGSRLDGEPRALPSGDGREGGNFVFRLRIGDD